MSGDGAVCSMRKKTTHHKRLQLRFHPGNSSRLFPVPPGQLAGASCDPHVVSDHSLSTAQSQMQQVSQNPSFVYFSCQAFQTAVKCLYVFCLFNCQENSSLM